jgi:hypothetical protein
MADGKFSYDDDAYKRFPVQCLKWNREIVIAREE